MTKRLHPCLVCGHKRDEKPEKFSKRRGLTRHPDGVCGQCRQDGARVTGGILVVPFTVDLPSRLGRAG